MSIENNVDVDASLASLDYRTLQLIDEAFDKANLSNSGLEERPGKRRRLAPPPTIEDAGGFIIDDEAELGAAGGFLSEALSANDVGQEDRDGDDSGATDLKDTIPMSLIPAALEILGLPPNDEEVLEVFRNASTGWSGGVSRRDTESANVEPTVSRKDWRAVCSVLLPNGIQDEHLEGDEKDDLDFENDSDLTDLEEEGGFVEESDEYDPAEAQKSLRHVGGRSGTRRGKNGKARTDYENNEPEDASARVLSTRQQLDCRVAFALFFPELDVDSAELDNRRLSIKDVSGAAKLLKEKLTAEDIIEMLRLFSSGPLANPSLTLSDFEKLMVAIRLV